MNDNVQPLGYGYDTSVAQRNQVLRNTYWLLALSLLPTVLGAWLAWRLVKEPTPASGPAPAASAEAGL